MAGASATAQTSRNISFRSEYLGEDRNIRIHLPANFTAQNDRQYPLLLTLDGEYLFYIFVGAVESLHFRQLIPETIVVGIDQNYPGEDGNSIRWQDCEYNSKSNSLTNESIAFKNFINKELIPHLMANYKVGKFKAIAGHPIPPILLTIFYPTQFLAVMRLSAPIFQSLLNLQ